MYDVVGTLLLSERGRAYRHAALQMVVKLHVPRIGSYKIFRKTFDTCLQNSHHLSKDVRMFSAFPRQRIVLSRINSQRELADSGV